MCRAHATVRELLANLMQGIRETVIADLEAGLEDFSRGTPQHANIVFIVLEPYYKALETARRIAELARELGIARVVGVANKVRSIDDEAAIRQFARAHRLELSAVIPHDESILEADRRGKSPLDFAPEAAAVRAIQELVSSL